MAFTNPPPIQAGQLWTDVEFQLYVLDNLQALFDLVGPNANTYSLNEIILGDTAGLKGITLTNGGLLVGSAGEPSVLAAGPNLRILQSDAGVLSWIAPAFTVDEVDVRLFS